MPGHRWKSFVASLALMGVAAWLLPGCGDRGEPLLPVAGIVSENNVPLITGSVTLHADVSKGNQTQHQPTGTIDKEGRYALYTVYREGAPPGWYKVIVHATEPTDNPGKASPGLPKSIINTRYNAEQTTTLTLEVKPDAPPGAYDLQLKK